MIRCSGCKVDKQEDEFHRNSTRKSGRASFCKPCAIEYQKKYRVQNHESLIAKQRQRYTPEQRAAMDRKRMYGISNEDYQALLDAQGGVCAICHNPCVSGKRLAVDHNHETGVVRGLLCTRCNPGIGYFQDDLALMHRAMAYLERTNN